MRKGLVILLTLAAVALLSSGAGASTQRSVAVEVSTHAGALQYLVSLGIDPRGVVIQRGAHNYAGPSCPGRGWTCTAASRVLQIAARPGDDNQFVCAGGGGSSNPPGDCTIIQVSTGGDNVARCVEASGDASASQSCQVSQTNQTGNNRIDVQQGVNVHGGASQDATQYAGTLQFNGSGTNDVHIQQQLQQQTSDLNAGVQSQDGHQAVYVGQTSGTGDNTAHVDQSLAQDAQAKGDSGATITENQNTDGAINTSAKVTQDSTSGRNSADVNQSNDLHGHVNKAATATQQQGTPTGGLAVFFDQNSTGVSTIHGEQHEHQHLNADQVGSLTQNQYGPMWADPTAVENVNNRYDINQSSDQHASDPTNQNDTAYGECFTSGNCTIDQHIIVQGDSESNSCSGPSCDISLVVGNNSDGSFSESCPADVGSDEGGCTVNVPDPPSPPFSTTITDSGPPR